MKTGNKRSAVLLILLTGLILFTSKSCKEEEEGNDPGDTTDTSCIPGLISPNNNDILDNGCFSYNKDLMLWTFKWLGCGSSTKYRLFVTGPAEITPLIDVEVSSTIYQFVTNTFIKKNLSGWTWKVCGFLNGEWGGWSEIRTFNIEPVSTDCSGAIVTPLMARDSVFNIMKDYYYWYNMPEAAGITSSEKANYKDPNSLLEAMRYKHLDRFSFITTFNEWHAILYGEFVGHGIDLRMDQGGNVRIVKIYKNSPLFACGVRRGWIVKKINNADVNPIFSLGDNKAISDLLGPREAGVTNAFLFQKPSGELEEIRSTKAPFTINTVLKYDTLHLSGGITGHLVFDSFFNPATDELRIVFEYFNSCMIKNLILDLRYNPGGDISIAQTLASYIAGNIQTGNLFTKLQFNDRHQVKNYFLNFITLSNAPVLQKLVVITSHETASASELLINCLKPYMDLVTIGDTTYGKPVGMETWNIGTSYTFLPVVFETLNSQNAGGYYDGLSPSKVVEDDITHDFSDRNELCLKEAIHFLESGTFSAKGVTEFIRHPVLSEKPQWMKNAFITLR